MEPNNDLSVRQSLDIISETLNNSRKDISRNTGKYFILWGILLTIFSLIVYSLWKTTGNSVWNNLWFAMPAIGYPLSCIVKKKNVAVPDNLISKLLSWVWSIYGVFAVSIAAASLIFWATTRNDLSEIMMIGMTPSLLLLFAICESISGAMIKNIPVVVSGWIIGIGGLILYYASGVIIEQMLIFTFCGVFLALTGIIMRIQNK